MKFSMIIALKMNYMIVPICMKITIPMGMKIDFLTLCTNITEHFKRGLDLTLEVLVRTYELAI